MKTNTRLSLLAGVACLALTSSVLSAQSSAPAAGEAKNAPEDGARGRGRGMGPGGAANPQGQVQRLDGAVTLTADQKAKALAIYQDEAAKLQAVRDDTTLTSEQRMTKLQEIQQAGRASVRALLTADQLKAYEAMPPGGGRGNRGGPNASGAEGRGERGPGGPGPGGGPGGRGAGRARGEN